MNDIDNRLRKKTGKMGNKVSRRKKERKKEGVSDGCFMNVEMKDEDYYSIFPKMLTINMIYFCNQEKK